jgi:glutamine synthetase
VEGWSYADTVHGDILPMSLGAALDALGEDQELREHLSNKFIDVFTALKRDEVARYEAEVEDPTTRDVTQWELDEYIRDL